MMSGHGRCILLGALLALFAAGCSTMKIRSDFDPSARFADLETYAWMPRKAEAAEDPRVADPELDKAITEAIDQALRSKGFAAAAPAEADFLVGYHAAVEARLEVMRMNEEYGYAPGWGWHGYLHSGDPGYRRFGWGWSPPESYVRRFEEGTIVVDIVDAANSNLIWRGSAEAEIHAEHAAEKQYARIEEAARRILATFPPTQPR